METSSYSVGSQRTWDGGSQVLPTVTKIPPEQQYQRAVEFNPIAQVDIAGCVTRYRHCGLSKQSSLRDRMLARQQGASLGF